ncbi:MAG: GNAT family N-acetyltransferase [Phenylobacterium sp.]
MVDLRQASDADLPEIVALTNRAYRETGPQASWNVESMIEGERTNLATLREEIAASPDASLLTWRDDEAGELLGHVWLEPADAGAWYLGMLTVRPDRQDQQLGRRLLTAAEDYARTNGAASIRMTVIHQRETLIAWYVRRGYRVTGETIPFPYDHERLGRPNQPGLYFDVLAREL